MDIPTIRAPTIRAIPLGGQAYEAGALATQWLARKQEDGGQTFASKGGGGRSPAPAALAEPRAPDTAVSPPGRVVRALRAWP